MLISMNWISEFTDLTGVNQKDLINRFTLSTAEVEEIYELGTDTQDVIVGEITEVRPHPESLKLHLLTINTGTELVPCVCGAANAAKGALVAFAKEGGMVKGQKIVRSKIAGYDSYGMCCSEKELGISEDNSGLLILPSTYIPGTDLKEYLPLDDLVFEVDNKSLTNRPDLWGHYGIAREIAALTKRSLKPLEAFDLTPYKDLPGITLNIESKENVLRYSCLSVGNITQKESPSAMKIRLTYCGMRPINLLADITNLIMLELGQPMHAFDQKILFQNTSGIIVRTFPENQQFTTLDGVTRTIDPKTLMICSDQEPAAIAGIMGGELSQITDTTNSLVLESAVFDAANIRISAQRLGLRTDASARYEKSLDPELTITAIGRYLRLLSSVDRNIRVTSCISDCYLHHYDTIAIDFDKTYVDKCTGIDISSDRIEETLTLLGFTVSRTQDSFHVIVPSYRATKDVTMKADIIEEITRIYGYDNFRLHSQLSLIQPVQQLPIHIDEYETKLLLAKRFCMNEVHTYLWYDQRKNKELGIITPKNIRIMNSITGDNAMIQSSVIPNLLNVVSRNISSFPDQRIFTISRVSDGFTTDGLCIEHKRLGLILASKTKSEKELFFELKTLMDQLIYELKNRLPEYRNYSKDTSDYSYLHPINTVDVFLGSSLLGYLSCLHPAVSQQIDRKLSLTFAELDMELLSKEAKKDILFTEPTRYPEVSVDLSLLLPAGCTFSVLQAVIGLCALPNLNRYDVIDQYSDAAKTGDKKSMTIRFLFSSPERTLESSEITDAIQKLTSALAEKDILLRE